MSGVYARWTCVLLAALAAALAPAARASEGADLGIAVLKRALPMGSVSAFWNADLQYRDTPTLKPRTAVTVAELRGPAAITLLRISHVPQLGRAGLMRGLVLQIRFDGAAEPAVLCPLPDFFCDGLNGRSAEFAARYVEKVPVALNAYFPMPFKEAAEVVIRNDTDVKATAYAYLEWEALPAWNPDLGYFHATWRRKAFVLANDTREEFFRVRGRGHLLGRHFSVASDEPSFRGFHFIMEGNNEVDIDGRRRCFDYLGSEDSFTFSWGFQKLFAAPRAGMNHLKMDGAASRLSIYRFHDHMPMRFDRELVWTIDWRSEDPGFGAQSGWVDYASVFYWYQDAPGGFRHEPLPPVEERCCDIMPAPEKTPDLGAALAALAVDPLLENEFAAADDLERVAVLQAYVGTHPFWIDTPEARGGHPGQPHPGRRGILAVHAEGNRAPCFVLRKVTLPAGAAARLRIVVSGDPYEGPGCSDFVLRAGLISGGAPEWFPEEVIDAGSQASEEGWKTLEYPLPAGLAGTTIGIVVKVAYGGPKGIGNEEAFFDAISVIAEPR
ncbi:MAG TPA: DUF2961 domain-containing protein [Planctomycetota bacterium]|jgi:hypothetical protein|nr:DUF2961 domain-containing protein [Planctomycetota bacterium]OQC19707.1 MAG: hypothetical protein BWX69_02463 [Planctomycetes bacterium ADurb.Bin069]HNR99866.1 DUF2961 domain-containing protein [Planctomycetota bacterium]HNU25726.1 DUF2961 domain-containing protein [Planctomycetota bacterium]HOE31361.1 DUF2961 domain-containing protein [Planctomycetota bacterium]